MSISPFSDRQSVEQVEEGVEAPKFDEHGLIPVVTTDFTSGEVLMHAYMNAEALTQTITLGEAVYWSRSHASGTRAQRAAWCSESARSESMTTRIVSGCVWTSRAGPVAM